MCTKQEAKEIETVQKTVTSPSQARPLVSNRSLIFYIHGFNLTKL